ncbi:MAG: hypothetical protein HeimC2_32740 [Candidatus Heimdallarchaeota archaeon LC_2]|nr:MAG: hypothetical protein HeimC2_32740 [Candidatus Heimdallarchaeota archaeon LC_2]
MYTLSRVTDEVLSLFKNQRPWTQEEISSSLPNSQIKDVKYSLRQLRRKGIITQTPNILDMRRVFYRISTQDEFYESCKNMNSVEIRFYQSILNSALEQPSK